MADRIITAEALITAKDATGDVFLKVAREIQGISKAAKGSVEIDRMTKSVEQAQKQLKALEQFQGAQKGFAASRAAFNEQKAALQSLARSLGEVEKPTRKMQGEFAALQGDVSRAAASFEKNKSAVLEAKHALEQFGAPLGNIERQQASLRGVIDRTTAAIAHQAEAERKAAAAHLEAEKATSRRQHAISHHGIVNYALGSAAMAVSAHGIMSGVERGLHVGSEYNSALLALRNAGRTPAEIRRMLEASTRTAIEAPTSDYIENLKVLNETTGAFGSVEHAMEHLTFMQKAATVLHATADGKINDSPGELGNKLARFFEMRGTAGNGELFEKEASEMMRAMVFTGGNFNPAEMLTFAQQAKSSLQNYSLEFMSKIAPSLISEVGGERAGTQANAFTSVILGKANDKRQAEAWEKYGLIDPKQMITKGGSPVAWTGGAVYHTDTALQNPLEFGEKYLLPALKAHGVDIDDRLELTKVLGTLFRNQNSNAFANELWQAQNRQRLRKDHGLIDQVDEPDAIYNRLVSKDAKVAMEALRKGTTDLLITMSSPLMPQAAAGMSILAEGAQHLSNFLKDNPVLAATAGLGLTGAALGGAGYLSYQISQGFGLGASAAALDGSAAALTGAAEVLGVAGLKSEAAGVATAVEAALGGRGGLLKGLLSNATISVGTLAIAGVAAVAIIDALSHGKNKDHAVDHPDFNDVYGPNAGVRLPSEATPEARPAGAGSAFSNQDTLPPSNATGPGHYVYGRAGIKQWVSDAGHWTTGRNGQREFVKDQPVAPLRDVPYFARGMTNVAGEPDPAYAGALGFIRTMIGKGKKRRAALAPYGNIPGGGMLNVPRMYMMPFSGSKTAFIDPDMLDPWPAKDLGVPHLSPNIHVLEGEPQYPYPSSRDFTLGSKRQMGGLAPMSSLGSLGTASPSSPEVTLHQDPLHVQADSTVKVEIRGPAGFETRQTFQGTNTRVSTGPSMPAAGVAPHIGRGDL